MDVPEEFEPRLVHSASNMAAAHSSSYWKAAKKIVGIGRNYADHAKGTTERYLTHFTPFAVAPHFQPPAHSSVVNSARYP